MSLKNLKTLVIHPEDLSTEFLNPIYTRIPNKTILRHYTSVQQIKTAIDLHDRVIMLGHGDPQGLFNMDSNTRSFNNMFINGRMVESLQRKKDNIYIWCYASSFVERHQLPGFATGMFISEPIELLVMNNPPQHDYEELITESNRQFSAIMSKYIFEETPALYTKVKEEYGAIASINSIAAYNCEKLTYSF